MIKKSRVLQSIHYLAFSLSYEKDLKYLEKDLGKDLNLY